jgi:hypothetical protein
VVRERWVPLTEDKQQQQSEEEIIIILFVYLFEYIPSIIYYVKEALFMTQIIINCMHRIVLFIFQKRVFFFLSDLDGKRRKLDKAENVKNLSLYIVNRYPYI